MRINKLKFIRNIAICIVALFVVAFILNMTPGYKRDKYKDITNIVIGDTNFTEDLKNLIYISEKGTIYLSEEDAVNLLNCKIYYEKDYNKTIIICADKVAAISGTEKILEINGAKKDILETEVLINNKIYLPISEMKLVFNIEMDYIKDNDVVIIDRLNEGIIKADVSIRSDIQYKPRGLSKVVGELNVGDKVSCFYTTSKGWRWIRTEDGVLRIG